MKESQQSARIVDVFLMTRTINTHCLPNTINRFVLTVLTNYVLCEVRTEILYTVLMNTRSHSVVRYP